jgi:tRNA 5-methylaminomethyl-2-thiouridine biosynthesis bifunctional protein
MIEPPRSQQFDDVYFSAEDGLAETRHVFVEGNGLPGRWQDRDCFTIAETGFGTGLNFLAAWKLFMETAPSGAFLDFISVEKYPLSAAEIRSGLAHWSADLAPYLEKFLAQYPLRTAGFHRVVFDGRVALTLIFDDVLQAFPTLEATVDCWFLDGFSPSKNPDMWAPDVFTQIARLSAPGATFATFTAAGEVKRGLRAAGFDVRKQRGFGRKRDMLTGTFPGEAPCRARKHGSVAIIGAGLAGTACAYVLKQYGFTPVVYEAAGSVAPGASGNQAGIYNPRFTAFRGPESDFYAPAFALAYRTLAQMGDIGFNPCGALHLITDDDRRKRLMRTIENWGWHPDHMMVVDRERASVVAGVTLDHDALYLPQSGRVNPQALCTAYMHDGDVRFNTRVQADLLEEDYIVWAGGAGDTGFGDLPLETVRGQITYLQPSSILGQLKTALCYNGYVVPMEGSGGVCGATFQPWLDHTDVAEEDNRDNLAKLVQTVPAFAGQGVKGGRAALRTASRDRFPVVGPLEGRVFVSTAHGSHGIISSLMGAHLIADQLREGPYCLPRYTVQALAPCRFFKAARKAG